MSTFSTVGSAKAFHVDEQGFAPEEVIPTALILQITTKVGFVPGDEPAIRVPFVNVDADAGFIAEAAEIPEGDPVTNEVLIHTGAVAQLEPISVDQYQQGNAA
ncbi:phage major capsid protein, partial [Mycolicibacterium porcinum]